MIRQSYILVYMTRDIVGVIVIVLCPRVGCMIEKDKFWTAKIR